MAVSEDLKQRMMSPSEGERHRALRELAGCCSPEEARPYLMAASEDPSRLVRFLARDLLAAAGDTRVAQPGRPEPPPPAGSVARRGIGWLLFSFDGRIGRFTYWTTTIGMSLVTAAVGLVITLGFGDSGLAGLMMGLLGIPSTWASLAIQVKRWHDRDKSGWWMFITLVPIIGGLWALVETGFLAGSPGANSYGESPV